MTRKLQITLFAILILLGMGLQPAPVQAAAVMPELPLCLPGVNGWQGNPCQELGPDAYLEQMASAGLTLPRNPLPAARVDAAFGELPYNYVRLGSNETPIFSNIDDALANQNAYRTIPAGFNFVTYVDYYQGSGSAKQYMIEPGMWIRGGSTNGRVVPSEFSGLVFSATPERKFGWIVYQTESQRSPGTDNPELTGHVLNRYDMIQVYQTVEANGAKWLMIGPDEWIDTIKAALVYPAESAPNGVDNGRWIEINLLEQTISVYQGNQLVFATMTSTGIPGWWTRPGLFQITEKLDSTPMSGAFEADRSDYYYLEDVPWTMYFDEARALHGAYWHDYFGYEQSHGCVNLSPADSHWLYLWGNVGDYVYVWDPSGQTPTDPSLYSAGGA